MNWLDFAVIGIVVLSAVFAFARGFVREALSIVAWVGAAAVTYYFFKPVHAQVLPYVADKLLSQLATGFGLFVVSLIVFTMLTGIAARIVHATGLSPIDRTIGLVFGAARGVLLVCLAYLVLDVIEPQADVRPLWVQEAKSGPYLKEGADVLRRFLPESLKPKNGDDASKPAKAATEAERAMRALITPAAPPATPPEETPAPTYRPGSQRDLDRLIGNQR